MAGTEKERDWDKEMAEVDRLLKKLPYADPKLSGGAEPTAKRPGVGGTASGGGAAVAGVSRGAGGWLATWIKVALGLLVGIGVTPGVWPYSRGCGLRLMFYLLGVATVIAAGLWASISSWRRRLGFAHILAQALIVWGALLLAGEVLPRVGPKAADLWLCPDVQRK